MQLSYRLIYVNFSQLDQPSFGLPRGVLINAPSYPALITAYKTYMVEVAQELGSTEPVATLEAASQAIIDLEILLANVTVSDEDRYDTEAIYHPYLLNEFQALTDGALPGFSVIHGSTLNLLWTWSI